MMPSIPIIIGKIISRGSRKIICLVRDRNTPFPACPIEVKKLAVIGCRPLTNVKNRKMRKYCSANRKYSSLPEPKIPIICLGNSWKHRKDRVEIMVAMSTAFR